MCSWEYFIRVHYTVGIEYLLQFLHVVNHVFRLAQMKILGLLETNSMLSTDASSLFLYILKYKGLNPILNILSELSIIKPFKATVEM